MPSLLIVEDEAIVAMDLREQLALRGFEVRAVVGESEHVIEAVRTQKPSVVLMDIKLEGEVDGVALAEEIFVCEDTPVVFLTAYSDHEILARAARTGAYGFLTKPVTTAALASTLQLAVEKHLALKARRQEAQWLSSALEVAAVRIGPDGAVRFMNPAAVRLLRWSPFELEGEPPRWVPELAQLSAVVDGHNCHELQLCSAHGPIDVKVTKYLLKDQSSLCLIHRV
jgi:CheY-like chemotaxis protein